jgi:TRAP-type C4-dicarboxylate transport system permease small subunit
MKGEIPNRFLTLPVFMLLIGFLLTKLSRYQLPQWIETTNIDIGILYLSLPIYIILIVVVVITMIYIYWLRKGYEML